MLSLYLQRKYALHYKIALIINYLGHCISVGALIVAFMLFLCLRWVICLHASNLVGCVTLTGLLKRSDNTVLVMYGLEKWSWLLHSQAYTWFHWLMHWMSCNDGFRAWDLKPICIQEENCTWFIDAAKNSVSTECFIKGSWDLSVSSCRVCGQVFFYIRHCMITKGILHSLTDNAQI